MPFQSRAQQRMAFARGMPWAHEWAVKTTKKKDGFGALPEHVGKIAAQPNDFRPRRKRTVTIAQRPDEVRGQPDTYHGPEMIGDYSEAMRRRRSRTARLAGSYRETKRYIANTPGAERRRYQLTSTYRPLHTRKRVYVAGTLAAGGAALAAHQIRKAADMAEHTDAFGVDRPDLSVGKVYPPFRMNRSESREKKAGVGLSAGGVASSLGAVHLADRSANKYRVARRQAASAHGAYESVRHSRAGMPQGNVWHAPGSEAHAATGKLMGAVNDARKARAGFVSARRMTRGAVGLGVGGAAAAVGGTALAEHAIRRTENRLGRPRPS